MPLRILKINKTKEPDDKKNVDLPDTLEKLETEKGNTEEGEKKRKKGEIESAETDADEALLLTWKKEVKEIAEKACDQMKNLYEIQLEERQKKTNEPTDKAKNWTEFDQTLEIKRIFERIHNEWEAKCLAEKLPCHTKQPTIFPDIHFKSAALYSSLFETLFENYIELVLQDCVRGNNFVKTEFVMIINSMHGSVEYLNKMFKIDDTSIFQLLQEENSNSGNKFQSKLQGVIKQFCEGEKLIFRKLIEDQEFNFQKPIEDQEYLQDLQDLFQYIYENLIINELENSEKNYSEKIFNEIKEHLSSTMHQEIKIANFKNPSQKTEALKELRTFRRDFSMVENEKLEQDIHQFWIKYSDTSGLISTFLSKLDFSNQKFSGKLKFSATKIANTGELNLKLNSVDKLISRREDKKINFSITVALLPNLLEKKKFKTKVYTDHDIKEPYLFNFCLDKCGDVGTSDIFKTKFMLKQGEGAEEKFGENQFLQFKLYDHSRTKTSKICLGTFFIPVYDIEEKKDRNNPREENFYEIDESLKMDMEIFSELAKRKCKFVHNINGCIKKERKATSTFMKFSKCTCIA